MPELVARLAELNPFKREADLDVSDSDELGEEIDSDTIAGGGHGARESDITRNQLRVSHALRTFLVREGVLSERGAGLDDDDDDDDDDDNFDPGRLTAPLRALVDRPHASVPPALTDRSHTLPEYFVSSSHNTYLCAHQLYGKSSAASYGAALGAGSRCIEIDAWDHEDDVDEPRVTHGYTLVSSVPFREVCGAIRDVADREAAEAEAAGRGYRPAPILVSLENHCGAHGQLRLVQIMKEVLGDRLLSEEVREKGHREQEAGSGEHVRLEELGSKVVVIVEHHLPKDEGDHEESSSPVPSEDEEEEEDEERKRARKAYKEKVKKAASNAVIVPELAALGVYAQSVKPCNNTWFDPGELRNGPHHHLINVSESGLAAHLPARAADIARHNAHHLMRVFPKGTRISSRNLRPVPFWAVGAQICALNWQTFESGMQLNEALFAGTDGYVLKPASLRPGGADLGSLSRRPRRRRRLRLRVAGATDVPVPAARADEARPYLTCSLVQAAPTAGRLKRKTAPYKHHHTRLGGFLRRGENPRAADPVWDDALEWEFDADDELVFLRMMVKDDISFARNPVLAVAAVRVLYVVGGWCFIRMLDLKGRETRCSLLVKFEVEDMDG